MPGLKNKLGSMTCFVLKAFCCAGDQELHEMVRRRTRSHLRGTIVPCMLRYAAVIGFVLAPSLSKYHGYIFQYR